MTVVNRMGYYVGMNPNPAGGRPDRRALLIAQRFCEGHGANGTGWPRFPCNRCMSKAKAVVQELAGQGQLLILTTDPDMQVVLSDPDVNTPGVERHGSGDTSNAARWAVMPKTGGQRRAILDAFARPFYPADGIGWTDDELIVLLGRPHQSVGPRRGELVAGGWLVDSQLRRPTRSGADAIVWVLSPEGRARLANERQTA